MASLREDVFGLPEASTAEYYYRYVLGNRGNDWTDFGYPRYMIRECKKKD